MLQLKKWGVPAFCNCIQRKLVEVTRILCLLNILLFSDGPTHVCIQGIRGRYVFHILAALYILTGSALWLTADKTEPQECHCSSWPNPPPLHWRRHQWKPTNTTSQNMVQCKPLSLTSTVTTGLCVAETLLILNLCHEGFQNLLSMKYLLLNPQFVFFLCHWWSWLRDAI